MEDISHPQCTFPKKIQLGLIGKEISYSQSPYIHKKLLEERGLKGEYEIIDCASDDECIAALEAFWKKGGIGLNITVPYKTVVANHINSDLSSINTLYRSSKSNSWLGTSTDGPGWHKGIGELELPLGNFTQIWILGNGGAVKALVHYLSEINWEGQILVFRRNQDKDKVFRNLLKDSNIELIFKPWDPDQIPQSFASKTLLIQGTSAPLNGDDLHLWIPILKQIHALCDLVYSTPSSLLYEAKKRAIPAQGGMAMLWGQARLSQDIWFGEV